MNVTLSKSNKRLAAMFMFMIIFVTKLEFSALKMEILNFFNDLRNLQIKRNFKKF